MNKKEQREFVYNSYGGRCAFCGTPLKSGWHISPIIRPKLTITATGGFETINDEVENKLPSCSGCNLSRLQYSQGEEILTIDKFKKYIESSFDFLKENPYYKRALRYGQIKEVGRTVVFYFEKATAMN